MLPNSLLLEEEDIYLAQTLVTTTVTVEHNTVPGCQKT